MKKYAKIIFDNAGGIILQLGEDKEYTHMYLSVEQAVEDYKEYLKDSNLKGWEGDDKDCKFDITDE